jgi:hypothetical protein
LNPKQKERKGSYFEGEGERTCTDSRTALETSNRAAYHPGGAAMGERSRETRSRAERRGMNGLARTRFWVYEQPGATSPTHCLHLHVDQNRPLIHRDTPFKDLSNNYDINFVSLIAQI